MATWLEAKYVGQLSNRLRNFKRKSGDLFNFSCPFCGDSQTDKHRARGYLYEKKGKTQYHCHKCGKTTSFPGFLKALDERLYQEFQLEVLQETKTPHQVDLEQFVRKMKVPAFIKQSPLHKLRKVSQLAADHPAAVWVRKRQIPNPYHARLFYCPKFFTWTNEILPGKFTAEAEANDEPRLIIPFISAEGNMHCYQGRSFDPNSRSKYITIQLDETIPRVYGLDTVNFSKRTYCFEGPIDAMFIANSIATAGGDIAATVVHAPKQSLVVIYDNEPRSPETKSKIAKAILNGYNVCIWPSNVIEKDCNDMVLAGTPGEIVKATIDQNIFSGLKAQLQLSCWSKV